jgi:hypothetical protein
VDKHHFIANGADVELDVQIVGWHFKNYILNLILIMKKSENMQEIAERSLSPNGTVRHRLRVIV